MTAERPKFGPIRPKHPGIQTRTAPDLSSNPTFRSQYRRKIRFFEVSTRPNQVWCADITYIPMRKGFLYLVAVMDWATQKVLAWKLSNTMEADFCIEALHDALACLGRPKIFNTDQGGQLSASRSLRSTSPRFTQVLKDAGVRISMDGKGRWMDNFFIERLWQSIKYECIYLHAFETGSELRDGLGRWVDFYNSGRPHSSLAGRTPDEAYHQLAPTPSPGHASETVSGIPMVA